MSREFVKSDFEPHLDGTFTLEYGANRMDVKLIEVTGKDGEFTEYFSLLFLGPQDNLLDQGTYRLTHDRLGTFELFLVPVITGIKEGVHYEAIFNRLKKKS